MARLGVDHFVAERAFNQKAKSVEGIYDCHDYFAERPLTSISNRPGETWQRGDATRLSRDVNHRR